MVYVKIKIGSAKIEGELEEFIVINESSKEIKPIITSKVLNNLSVDLKKVRYFAAHKGWTGLELQTLRDLFSRGIAPRLIAKQLGRSNSAIYSKLWALEHIRNNNEQPQQVN